MAHRQRAKAKTKGPRAPGDEQMENALMEVSPFSAARRRLNDKAFS